MRLASLSILLLVPVLVCAAHANRGRGLRNGDYSVFVAGYYKGTGTATYDTTLNFSADVKTGSAAGKLTLTDLPVTQGYFNGTGTVIGQTCIVQGRIDLPDATDPDQDDSQAVTARITGTFKDAAGNFGRFVAVQKNGSPGNSGNISPGPPVDRGPPNGNN